ncbi:MULTISPECIES: rhodanese-like domain-containing protein [Pseudomonadaceae]|uniref:rhodanese-like domain-containing protein n=1 Tax=Pseudomonadaceae TaxID=135621 RepID=UPI0015E4576F|nr:MULTISPECIES: rhodanese-like domain-containing protein [Pseudomonadaceae]MBA1278612.1 rhodanese-like domain-containing protein [Stutzerimonas stutzeri]MBC8648121.1 rhodanese-like domain-containing protein [Pseudomonas sp. MT4]QXY94015.1 rhodanese-like domain-containing protein [Pseudomonas sp. MTM4]
MHRLFLLLMMATGTAIGGEIDQPAALAALQRADSILIDVRTAQEYAEGALPGATRIETQDLSERIASVAPDKDAPIVLYCRSGRRSSAAQDILQDMGYRQVINAGAYQDLQAVVPPR